MPEIVEVRASTAREIKRRAGEIISSRLPDWKQRNLIARQAELETIRSGGFVSADGVLAAARVWTPGEIQELAAIRAVWDWVTEVRGKSDAFEAVLVGGGTPNFTSRDAWPAFPGQEA